MNKEMYFEIFGKNRLTNEVKHFKIMASNPHEARRKAEKKDVEFIAEVVFPSKYFRN